MDDRGNGREAVRLLSLIRRRHSAYWERAGQTHSLNLFHAAARHVPAYKDFLRKSRIDAEKIKTFADLQQVPPVTKDNYLRRYPLDDLSWDGTLAVPLVYTSTSGSTGVPLYFHRSPRLDWQSSLWHEFYYLQNSPPQQPVLVVVCFGMGVWIGGLITYQAFAAMQERGYPVSVITPGINKIEIFKALKKLAPLYQRVVLVGYAPFLKDIIDEAPDNGLDLKKIKLRLLFAAEPFTEDFRDYMVKGAGLANPYLDTGNIYGTAELGTMAMETPLSILVRRLCRKQPKLFSAIFEDIHKTPTLAQFIPILTDFSHENGELLISGDSSLPLVRYAIGDHGGVYSFRELEKKLADLGVDLKREAARAGLATHSQELPFVYVYERSDFSTTLYGLQVHPEPIRQVLLEKPLSAYLTGKFTLETTFDNHQDQYLYIHLEMRKNKTVPASIKKAFLLRLAEQLDSQNAEFRELHKFLGARALPRPTFWPAEDLHYFKPGIKQKWVKK